MNIYQDIDNVEVNKLYNTINSKQHMKELTSREYDFLFKELRYKRSFHFVDRDFEYNLVMKIDNEKQIEELVKNRKIINVTRCIDGPVIEMNIQGFAKPFSFIFDLADNESLHNLKILTKKREAKMHFVLYEEGKLTKVFSALLNIDDRILERLAYIVELTYDGCYPYIEYCEDKELDSRCIEINYQNSLLDEVLIIIDNLQKWGSGDSFSILLGFRDSYRLIFKGNITNFNYIMNELKKKFEIIGESDSEGASIPFLKYDRGMIYFYKTRFSDDNK